MNLTLHNLAPERTASIRLFTRGTATQVGSDIVGTGVGYSYTFPNVPVGDYDYELLGFTAQPSSKRALRVTSIGAFEAATWWELDAAFANSLGANPVIVIVQSSSLPVPGATVSVSLNNSLVSWSRTDALGRVNLLLAATTYAINVAAPGFYSSVGTPLTAPRANPLTISIQQQPTAPPESCDVCPCEPTPTAGAAATLGSGCCAVDHNYGGNLALAYRGPDCEGIVGATVSVFTAVAWTAGNTGLTNALLTTTTTVGGLWVEQFLLNEGNYVIRFEKPGQYGPDIYELTVASATTSPSGFSNVPFSPYGTF